MKSGFLDRLANWYFNKNSLPFWCIAFIDVCLVFLSYIFVYLLFHSASQLLGIIEHYTLNVAIYLVVYLACFRLFRTYSGIFRYSSFVDLQRVGASMAVSLAVILLARLLMHNHPVFSYVNNMQIVGATLLATLLLWMIRVFVKILYDSSFTNLNAKYAFIYGVKSGGIGIAKQIRSEKPVRFILKGFIADEKTIENHVIMGVKVYRMDERLLDIMKSRGIEALIVSAHRVNAFRRNAKLQERLIKAGIHIYFMQEEQELGHEEHATLHEVSVEDLLPRDEIQVDMKQVARCLAGKCVMVTGSAGSIGSELVNQIASCQPSKLILIDQAETPQHDIRLRMKKQWSGLKVRTIVGSICEEAHMEAIFEHYRPEYVFHAAAYKHVPMMEDNPGESIYNNVYGTKVIADLSVKYGVKKFVMISTDKAVNPTNVMGCSKRICEIYVQSLNKVAPTHFVTTRFGNVLGSNGSVIPLFREQIKAGGPLTVTHRDIIRYFMLIPEACKLVLEAGTKGQGGEIFVFDMGEPVKIADLAQRMIMLSGAKNVTIKYTGLRAGEKLYEEVLGEKETTKPSFHDKIRIANVREYDYNAVCRDIDALIHTARHYDDMETVKMMKQIVPEYKSNNSVYSILDQQ